MTDKNQETIPPKGVETSVETCGSEVSTGFEAVFARLRCAMDARNDSEMARALGVAQGSVSSAKTRRQIPPAWVTDIALQRGISADWLLTGKGSMQLSGEAGTAPVIAQPCIPDLVMIPKVEARLSAGTGSLENGGEVQGLYAFRRDFLARKGQAARMVLMEVAGDSMQPALEEGDTVLVDQSQTSVISGKIYAVSLGDEVLVKQIDKAPGKYSLRSKNKDYEPILIDLGDDSADFRIIGRVIWKCREM